MNEGFNVHLASNVAHETYPKNTASDFITPLAEEIVTGGEKWEVAVKSIMYPSYVASTTEKDGFDLMQQKLLVGKEIEVPKLDQPYRPYEGEVNLPSYVEHLLKYKGKNTPTKEVNAQFAQSIVTTVNASKACTAGIFTFEYKKDHNKFILHVPNDEILISFGSFIQLGFGFTEKLFGRGTYWAWSAFDADKYKRFMPELIFKVYSLQRLKKYEMTQPLNEKGITTITLEHQNSLTNPSTTTLIVDVYVLETYGHHFRIRNVTSNTNVTKPYAGEYIVLKLDDSVTKTLALKQSYYELNTDLDIPVQAVRDVAAKKWAKLKNEGFKFTLYSNVIEDSSIVLEKVPNTLVHLPKQIFTSPVNFLDYLNAKSTQYGYLFKFNKDTSRFELTVNDKYYVRLSHTLASILGFRKTTESAKFAAYIQEFNPANDYIFSLPSTFANVPPLLSRGINSIYVYTDIVESSLVGDVRAPLLLVCPFKTDKANPTIYQEFLNPTYVPIHRNTIQKLEITLRDGTGEEIPFLYGKTVLSLHFRKQ